MFKYRPKVISQNSICSGRVLSLKLSVAYVPATNDVNKKITPISRLSLLQKNKFNLTIKIQTATESHERIVSTDNFGTVYLKQKLKDPEKVSYKAYALNQTQNIKFFLGKYEPSILDIDKKIIISDFDKTLVDTKYSTIKELYHSLTRPVSDFPNISPSMSIFKEKIFEGYLPFILSSSPNFYGPTIKQWLTDNNIDDQNIFLKDYRQFFSLFSSELFFKDLSAHGVHKLNSLLDIFLMTDIPSKIILLGDSSEADPLIYSIFKKVCSLNLEPDYLWDEIRTKKEFRLTDSQSLQFLGKLYEIKNKLRKQNQKTDIKIYIRNVPGKNFNKEIPDFIKKEFDEIQFY